MKGVHFISSKIKGILFFINNKLKIHGTKQTSNQCWHLYKNFPPLQFCSKIGKIVTMFPLDSWRANPLRLNNKPWEDSNIDWLRPNCKATIKMSLIRIYIDSWPQTSIERDIELDMRSILKTRGLTSSVLPTVEPAKR